MVCFFREASYPQLKVNREYDQTSFEWLTEQNVPLDLNIPITINGEEYTVEMENGYGSISMGIEDELEIDPNDWILLMQEPEIILGTDYLNNEFSSIQLNQNFPNPFSETTQIGYYVSKSENISIVLFDILGNEIKTLVNKIHLTGNYSISLHRNELSDGVYYYRLISDDGIISKQLQIME
ncbi:T9SS type A sorting domain-containing protein [Lentimicrobium sp. L6]|uniref:T9SS type A sorting domain-containing protein n=1 Tax=Lentimicrobium sp. L6 TaxID=2735916 RepID=UPI00155760A1|nr:T9SS type A sorting domain-containing protein [Lentimicrobium sp. L6]NPD85338.1 T9SS type A sorting domain-containing protein [Lentimicrobium sp. L6]